MKLVNNRIAYSLLILALFTMTGCFDDPGTDILLKEKFVSFAVSTSQIREPDLGGSIRIDLSRASSEDVEVTYEIEEMGAIEGVDYEVVSPNPLIIPAGEFSADLEIEVTDNSVFETEARQFKVTITGVSGGSVQGYSSATFTIVNDDCPSNTAIWFGSISIEDVGFATTTGSGAANAAGACNILVVLGDVSGAGVGANLPISFYFTPSSPGATSGTVNVPAQNTFSTRYTYEGTGTYNETTQTILVNYKFTDTQAPTGPNNWTGQTEILPQ